MKRALLSSAAAVLVIGAGAAQAQGIVSQNDPKEPVVLQINSVEVFKQGLELIDSGNASAVDNIAVNPETGLTVMTEQGKVSLKGPFPSAYGPQFIVSVRDENSGTPLKLKTGDLIITDDALKPLDYSLESYDQAKIPASVMVVIDDSGSMAEVTNEVRGAANKLFTRLPDHLHCQALMFAERSRFFGDPQSPCTSENIGLDDPGVGGSTNIFAALERAVDTINARQNQTQKVILVLTDGDPSDFDAPIFERLKQKKGDTKIVFFWLGNKSANAENLFSPLADEFVQDPMGAWQFLNDYFEVFSDMLSKQAVVTIQTTP